MEMRRFFALSMIAILSLTLALAALGCGKKQEETTTTTPPAETSAPPETSMSNMSADTSMGHMGADTTKH